MTKAPIRLTDVRAKLAAKAKTKAQQDFAEKMDLTRQDLSEILAATSHYIAEHADAQQILIMSAVLVPAFEKAKLVAVVMNEGDDHEDAETDHALPQTTLIDINDPRLDVAAMKQVACTLTYLDLWNLRALAAKELAAKRPRGAPATHPCWQSLMTLIQQFDELTDDINDHIRLRPVAPEAAG